MTGINLLPWREIQFAQAKQQLQMHLICSSIVSLLLGITLHLLYGWWLDLQQQTYQDLNKKMESLAEAGERASNLVSIKKQLAGRITWLHTLAAKRIQTVNLFDTLTHSLPDGLYFTEIIRQVDSIVITGWAQSSAEVSQLLQNIEQSGILKEASLNNIKTKEKEITFDKFKNSFSLQAIYEE